MGCYQKDNSFFLPYHILNQFSLQILIISFHNLSDKQELIQKMRGIRTNKSDVRVHANQVEYKTTWHTSTHLVSSAGRGATEVDAGLSYGGLCSVVATLPWKKLYI